MTLRIDIATSQWQSTVEIPDLGGSITFMDVFAATPEDWVGALELCREQGRDATKGYADNATCDVQVNEMSIHVRGPKGSWDAEADRPVEYQLESADDLLEQEEGRLIEDAEQGRELARLDAERDEDVEGMQGSGTDHPPAL